MLSLEKLKQVSSNQEFGSTGLTVSYNIYIDNSANPGAPVQLATVFMKVSTSTLLPLLVINHAFAVGVYVLQFCRDATPANCVLVSAVPMTANAWHRVTIAFHHDAHKSKLYASCFVDEASAKN